MQPHRQSLRPSKPGAYTGGGSSSVADHAPTPEGDLGSPSAFSGHDGMYIAYLDEFGHVGPYIDTAHRKFFHNPVFGYAGIILPAEKVRAFGAKFERLKERQFRSEIHDSGAHPRRWEKKGSEIFTTGSHARYPERASMIADLSSYLDRLGGRIFFYGERKPVGSTKETGQTPSARTSKILTEVVRRLCREAERDSRNLTVLLDEGGPMPREEAITSMASFIYASQQSEMKRIVEVPMQLESHRYGAMQFADWLCAIASRTVHFHFSDSNEFQWAPAVFDTIMRDRTSRESRVWLPDEHQPVKFRALAHPGKWTEKPVRHQPAAAGLTYTIGLAMSGAEKLQAWTQSDTSR